MSWCGSIQIKFYRAGAVSETFLILHNAGWGFYGDLICYDSYTDPNDPAFSDQRAPASALPEILRLLDAKSAAGEIVMMDFYWQGDEARITCILHTPKNMTLYWDGSAPFLSGSTKLTDLSWLLSRIAVPLMNAGYDPEEIECIEGH